MSLNKTLGSAETEMAKQNIKTIIIKTDPGILMILSINEYMRLIRNSIGQIIPLLNTKCKLW
jgi:hypothetical protein